jgi:hypothetical protein
MSYLGLLKAAKERLLLGEISEKRTSPPSTGKMAKEAPPANYANEAKEASGQEWAPSYAHPWPDALPGLGPRRIGPLDACSICGEGSWCRYGERVLCLSHARERMAGEQQG